MNLQVRKGSWFSAIEIKFSASGCAVITQEFDQNFKSLNTRALTLCRLWGGRKGEKTLISMAQETSAFKNIKAWLMLYTLQNFYTHITIKENNIKLLLKKSWQGWQKKGQQMGLTSRDFIIFLFI